MKRVLKISIWFTSCIIAVACSKYEEGTGTGTDAKGSLVFTAISGHLIDDETRTVLDGSVNNKVLWESGDAISINEVKYVTTEGGKTEVKFYKNDTKSDPTSPYIAGYPYNSFQYGDSTVVLPDIIDNMGAEMSKFPMLAHSTTPVLIFYNLCGALHFQIKGEGVLRKMSISDCEVGTSGRAKVAQISSTSPGLEMIERNPQDAVAMDCGSVSLSKDNAVDAYCPTTWDNYRQLTFFFDIQYNPTFCHLRNSSHTMTANGRMYRLPINIKPAELNQDDETFSVSPSKKVRFSKGNLVYDCKTGQWGFFNEQNAYNGISRYLEGTTTKNIIDLHTWGYNATQSADPTGAYLDNVPVYHGNNLSSSQDWGSQIEVAPGENRWRTMAVDEWMYLLGLDSAYCRDGAKYKWGRAVMKDKFGDDCYGLVIMPDDFKLTDDPYYGSENSFKPMLIYKTYTYYNDPVVWKNVEETCGAVFLPECNSRQGETLTGHGQDTYFSYWSSTAASGDDYAESFFSHYDEVMHRAARMKSEGLNVRLVRDVE